MLVGMCCAIIAVVAKAKSRGQGVIADDNGGFVLGVITCIAGTVAASMTLVFANHLGSINLNAVDTVFYMAVPVFLLMIVPSFCIPHASSCQGGGELQSGHTRFSVPLGYFRPGQ